MGRRGAEAVRERFGWAAVAREMEAMYERIAPVKIAFLVERPTQFEAPFYRFAALDTAHEFRVLFTGRDVAAPVFDPELGAPVSWGIDLLGGYPHEVCPAEDRRAGSHRGSSRSGATC